MSKYLPLHASHLLRAAAIAALLLAAQSAFAQLDFEEDFDAAPRQLISTARRSKCKPSAENTPAKRGPF